MQARGGKCGLDALVLQDGLPLRSFPAQTLQTSILRRPAHRKLVSTALGREGVSMDMVAGDAGMYVPGRPARRICGLHHGSLRVRPAPPSRRPTISVRGHGHVATQTAILRRARRVRSAGSERKRTRRCLNIVLKSRANVGDGASRASRAAAVSVARNAAAVLRGRGTGGHDVHGSGRE